MKWGILIGITGVSLSLGFEACYFINNIKSESYPILVTELIELSWIISLITIAMSYVACLTLLLERANWKKRLSFLAPVGKLGLTNYIFHIIIFILLFRNFGLGLNGIIGPFWRLILALPVFVLIIFFSRWWLKFFKMGPFEWFWRSLTYWKIQPMRLNPLTKP
jgi:uncharacterized protein